jgi:hypothetical protein
MAQAPQAHPPTQPALINQQGRAFCGAAQAGLGGPAEMDPGSAATFCG